MGELTKRLDILAKHTNPAYWADEWLKDFRKVEEERDPFEVLEAWLASDPMHERFRFVAACIEVAGNREDLAILDRYTVEYEHLFNVGWIRESTKFAVKRRSLE